MLADLYQQMKATAVHTDLDDFGAGWAFRRRTERLALDDHAPLADIRKAITRPARSGFPGPAPQAPIH